MKKKILILLIIAGFSGCKSPEARRPISTKTGSFIDKSVEINRELNASQHKQIEAIISKNPEKEFIASANGFWYYYNTKIDTDSITPNFGDIINFNYNISDINGALIYSENTIKTQNYIMDKEELFTGLREGLKLMKAGETATFFFPSQKAYGFYGDENKIGRNTSLICKVTINAITRKDLN